MDSVKIKTACSPYSNDNGRISNNLGNAGSSDGPADISVIVPVYNREMQLPAMLESLQNQTVRPAEVIFVDNNSTDNTPVMLREWRDVMQKKGWTVRIVNESRRGAALARKAGHRLAASTLLSFFDSDDVMHPDFIEKGVRDFQKDPSLDISAHNVTFILPSGKRRNRRISPKNILRNHLVQGLLSTQSYIIRNDSLKKAGGWNEDIGGWDDWELGLRLLLSGAKVKLHTESYVDVTVHENSITGLGYLHRKGDWEKTLDEMERITKDSRWNLSASKRDYILTLLAYRRAILAAHYYREGDDDGARRLFDRSVAKGELSSYSKFIITAAYHYTRLRLPGAGAIFPPLLSRDFH